MSQARARYLKAQKDYEYAVASEKNARLSSDKMSPELNVAAIGLEYAGNELARARENFYSAFRADLSAHDLEFKRLERNAQAAQHAFYQAKLMVTELRRVLTTSLMAPEGLDTLDAATRDSYARLNVSTRQLAKGGVASVEAELRLLEERAEEHQGRAYCYLEAALEREEGRAA